MLGARATESTLNYAVTHQHVQQRTWKQGKTQKVLASSYSTLMCKTYKGKLLHVNTHTHTRTHTHTHTHTHLRVGSWLSKSTSSSSRRSQWSKGRGAKTRGPPSTCIASAPSAAAGSSAGTTTYVCVRMCVCV